MRGQSSTRYTPVVTCGSANLLEPIRSVTDVSCVPAPSECALSRARGYFWCGTYSRLWTDWSLIVGAARLPLVQHHGLYNGTYCTDSDYSVSTVTYTSRYITPPLLLGGRKFDIRVYLLVVAARPYVVLYADGYVRLSCASYNAASGDVTVHLTNQFQQKKHPDYMDMREDTVRSSFQLTSYHL